MVTPRWNGAICRDKEIQAFFFVWVYCEIDNTRRHARMHVHTHARARTPTHQRTHLTNHLTNHIELYFQWRKFTIDITNILLSKHFIRTREIPSNIWILKHSNVLTRLLSLGESLHSFQNKLYRGENGESCQKMSIAPVLLSTGSGFAPNV